MHVSVTVSVLFILLVFHARTKRIQLRYHHIRELVEDGTIALKKILSVENPADMLTKSVTI